MLLKRRIGLLLSMVGVFMLLAGCSSVKEPITADSPHFWDKYVVYPLSELITYVAKLTGDNYGLSIILVTILIRLLILPLMIKQLRSSKAMQALQPEMQKLAYNPLFIYGGVGLGKTHLMHAIGHYVIDHNPSAKVVYLSSEKFTNEFINSIRDNKAVDFRNRYRNVDVLLIDDIQFLAGKEQTQEEFFHTFNTLHEESKQIVISSDRPPKEIPTLEDRLRSRFEWGLITDITPPDLETRIAILRKKAKAEGLDIPNEVMLYIANQIDSNIRELEGALIRVVAYSSLINKDINADLAAEALKDIIPSSKPKVITIKEIQRVVGQQFNIKLEDFKAKKRTKSVAFPRQIAMYLSREMTDSSLPKIGEEFGGRDHTTVIHAHEKISKLLADDEQLQQHVKEIKEQLK